MTKVSYVAAPPHSKQQSKQKKDNKVSFVSKDANTSSQTPTGKIPEVRIHGVFWPRVFLYIFAGIFVYLLCQIFIPLLHFQIYIQWWNRNGGKEYKNVFSITQFAYYGSFRLYGIIGSLMSSGLTTIQNKSQYLFILGCITAWGKYDDSDKDRFLLPVHICGSIVVGDGYPTVAYGVKDDDGKDVKGWDDKLEDWGVPKGYAEISQLVDKLDPGKWNVDDNFFHTKYNIPQASPFILAFQSGANADTNGRPLYPGAFLTAVGINLMSKVQDNKFGGWWGFVNTGVATAAADYMAIYQYLYASDVPQILIEPTPKCSVSGEIGSILGTTASFSMAGAAFPPYGAIAGAVAGLVVGGLTSGIKAGTKKCKGAGA